jgi:hypothetical protein
METIGRHADRAIYVLIAVLAISVALVDTGATAEQTFISVVGTAVALTLAEMFAARVGISIREGRRPTDDEVSDEWEAAIAGLIVAGVPILFFLLALVDVFDLDDAFRFAQLAGFAVLGGFTYEAARARGYGRPGSVIRGLGLLAAGEVLILLNSLVK